MDLLTETLRVSLSDDDAGLVQVYAALGQTRRAELRCVRRGLAVV